METTLLTVAILLYGKISAHPIPNCNLVHIDQSSHITPPKLTESPPSLVNSSLCSTSLDNFFFQFGQGVKLFCAHFSVPGLLSMMISSSTQVVMNDRTGLDFHV